MSGAALGEGDRGRARRGRIKARRYGKRPRRRPACACARSLEGRLAAAPAAPNLRLAMSSAGAGRAIYVQRPLLSLANERLGENCKRRGEIVMLP